MTRRTSLASPQAGRHAGVMDDWMRRPGARVRGHHAAVHRGDAGLAADCSCGYRSPAFVSEGEACLLLTLHLQGMVRWGGEGLDDGDGLARRTRSSSSTAAA